MVTTTYGSALYGTNARTLTITISTGQGGRSGFSGLKTLEPIRASIQSLGYKIPQNTAVTFTPSLPATQAIPCALPLALGFLRAGGEVFPEPVENYMIVGALSPEGRLKPVRGALPIAIRAREEGFKGIVLPKANASEAAIVNNLTVTGVECLQEAIDFFKRERHVAPATQDTRELFYRQLNNYDTDLSGIPGHQNSKRALEIAAAGGHPMLMVGAPGLRKAEIAKRLPTVLPPPTLLEALETTKVYSVAGKLGTGAALMAQRPFRAIRHTISGDALTGDHLPGELSLSHNGVLFMDEVPEFHREVPEIIAQSLKTRTLTRSQAGDRVVYPAGFMLIAGMNPCPCGYFSHPENPCTCSREMVQQYLGRISGPLAGYFDLQVETGSMEAVSSKAESSADVRERAVRAREIQSVRFGDKKTLNAMMSGQMVENTCPISAAGKTFLERVLERSGLPPGSSGRVLKVSRTIADLAGSKDIQIEHLAEAIRYRCLDRLYAQSVMR